MCVLVTYTLICILKKIKTNFDCIITMYHMTCHELVIMDNCYYHIICSICWLNVPGSVWQHSLDHHHYQNSVTWQFGIVGQQY